MATPNDQAFAPVGIEWTRVSPALTRARRTSWSLIFSALLIATCVAFFIPNVPKLIPAIAVIIVLAVYAWGIWFFGRRTKSWGYCQREDDLIVVHGFMFRRLVIVPYGRMQLVDVAAGPLERKFGVARLQLHTAAATTDASIPGLTPEVASELRDTLAHLAEIRAAGL